jgi:hypothetical protein
LLHALTEVDVAVDNNAVLNHLLVNLFGQFVDLRADGFG